MPTKPKAEELINIKTQAIIFFVTYIVLCGVIAYELYEIGKAIGLDIYSQCPPK